MCKFLKNSFLFMAVTSLAFVMLSCGAEYADDGGLPVIFSAQSAEEMMQVVLNMNFSMFNNLNDEDLQVEIDFFTDLKRQVDRPIAEHLEDFDFVIDLITNDPERHGFPDNLSVEWDMIRKML